MVSANTTDTSCIHCFLPIDQDSVYHRQHEGETLDFCCLGCATVWETIHGSGLGSYYAQREITGDESPVDFESTQDFKRFDREGVFRSYVKQRDDGLHEISLLVDGIHCAACIWLIEKFLQQSHGIHEVLLNIGTHRAFVVWDQQSVKLSEILERFHKIGYTALPYDPALHEQHQQSLLRQILLRLAVSGFCAGNIMLFSISLYAGYFSGMEEEYKFLFEAISGLLSLPAMAYSAIPFWQGAWRAMRIRQPNMDFLIALGIGITFTYSVVMLLTKTGDTYFDSCAMIIFFLLIGRTLEHLTKTKVISITERLSSLSPKFAARLNEDGEEATVTLDEIETDDRLLVRPGDTVPVDGIIESGETEIDESSLTGESQWRFVTAGENIFGGTANQSNAFVMVAQAVGQDTILQRIVRLVEDASQRKPKIQRIADHVASWFVWVVLLLALGTWAYWNWWGDGGTKSPWLIAVSVIIIACPCALGLATPTAILAGTSIATRLGLLFKGGDLLEEAARITDIIFDKTGTLSQGTMQVISVHDLGGQKMSQWFPLILPLEHLAHHPIAEAIENYALSLDYQRPPMDPQLFRTYPGRGISGYIDNQFIIAGNCLLLKEHGIPLPESAVIPNSLQQPYLEIYVVINQTLQGKIVLQDMLRKEAPEILKTLQQMKIHTHILSGDHQNAVNYLAQHLSIEEAHGNLLPDQKLEYIQKLQEQGKRVLMVGDGINDAPALNQANVGIAVRNATDISLDTADIVLMHSQLHGILHVLQISKQTRKLIKQNLGISLIYNALTIPAAMMGWINPLFAALAMACSSILVTLNALRFRQAGIKY
ncbi:MAG: heavy metal translocating P-type ATPase [SAR324 cluster bacterium]|nr:heavy metal translocating P-type ATPase [SAR324 cluster bacterium]